jgi:uncharacterized membrane protein YkoI
MQRHETSRRGIRDLIRAAAVLAGAALAGLALASPLAAATPVGPATPTRTAAATPASSTRALLSVDHAEQIAASKLPMTYPVMATLETVDGRKVYDVDLTLDERLVLRHVLVDAHDGKILRVYTTRGTDDPAWIGGGGGL